MVIWTHYLGLWQGINHGTAKKLPHGNQGERDDGNRDRDRDRDY